MGNTPTTQVMNCSIKWNLPATYTRTDIFGITILSKNFVNDLNAIPASIYDGVLAEALTLDAFVNKGLNVSSVQVTGSKWINDSGKAALTFQLKTVSDPVTAADIIALILGLSATIIAILIAALGPETAFIGDIVIVGLALAGVFTILAVTCSIVSSSVSQVMSSAGGLGAVAVIAVIGVAGVLGYMYLKEPKRRATAHRYVGKAKRAAKRFSGTLN